MQPPSGRRRCIFEAPCEATTTHQMAVGYFDPPCVPDRSKDLGATLVARWLVPPDPANFTLEPRRESLGRRFGGTAVHEDKFEAVVSVGTGEIFEYQFNRSRLGGRRGNNAHAEGQAVNVHADNSLGAVGASVGATLIVEGDAPVRGSSREVRVYNHHREQEIFSTEGDARRRVQSCKNPGPRPVPRPPAKLGPDPRPGTELLGQEPPLALGVRDIEHRVNDMSKVTCVLRSAFGGNHEKGFQENPLGVGQVT